MKKEEVMIGNWIQCETGQKRYQVEGWHMKPDEDDDCVLLRHSDPIPLTEEELIKLGFEVTRTQKKAVKVWPYHTWKRGGFTLLQPIFTTGANWGRLKAGDFSYSPCQVPVNKVHQLQIIYLAMTGEHLQ